MSDPMLDELGLKLDQSNPLDVPPAIIIYGVSGAGKSTEMARAFPRCLYVQTAPTVLRPFATFMEANPDVVKAEGLKMPNRLLIPKHQPGTDRPLDPRPAIDKIVGAYLDASRAGNNPYEGIVFDEWTELAFRVHEAIQRDEKYGKNNFARIDAIKDFHYRLAELPRSTGTVLGLVCHEMDPVYDMPGKTTPNKGRLIHRGGPRMPIKGLSADVSAAMDIVLRICVEDSDFGAPQRTYITEVGGEWIAKFRSTEVRAREPLGLRDLLVRGGYKLGA